MEFFNLINKRQSIRSFTDQEVPEEDVKKIIEAAIRAPSAGDLQAYEIFVVKDSEKKKALSKAALNQESVTEASVCLVFCAHPELSSVKYGERGKELYCRQDATIATAYAQLATADMGYGSVWVGAFDEDDVREVIGADESLKPVSVLPIGVPDEKPEMKPRREYNDIVHE